MKQINQVTGKVLYAITFLIVIPVGLWFWAKSTQAIIQYPPVESKTGGGLLMLMGAALMLWAMYLLKKIGKGLPMNAYPPTQLVTSGPYRLFKHPIYWGFGMILVGCSLFTGSASGLWLVSPFTILGMIALVKGYEEIDLKRRFPDPNIKTFLDFPEQQSGFLVLRDWLASLFWIFFYLLLSNFTIYHLTGSTPPLLGHPFSIYHDSRYFIPAILGMFFLITVPFVLKKKDTLREWLLAGIFSLVATVFIALLFPSFGAQYLPGHRMVLFTVPLFLILISLKSVLKQSLMIAIPYSVMALILIIFQLVYTSSASVYLVDSILIFILSVNYLKIWGFLKNSSEKIANSWKEWVFGNVRVINHGFYVGTGAFFGILLAGILAGKEYAFALLVFTLVVTVTSALWAQLIEGSAKLKRPFGYYGGLVGILFGSIAVWIMGLNAWVVIGVASVVMPWIQAAGRLRCLVNGCCHGRRVDDPNIGIRFFQPRSRVCNISGLKGELLHPTQLYSIIWLFFVGMILLSLWDHHLPVSFIFGIYLILTGLGRFVEEAYRGEVQTPNVRGLHLYQWTAIVSVMIGILMTIIQVAPVEITPGFGWETLLVSATGGLFIFCAMGVDFPYSNARFSRLV